MSSAAPEAPTLAAPFHFFDLHVVRTLRTGSTMLRITFGGDALEGFRSGGRDQRIKLFLPHPGQKAPVVPVAAGENWFPVWRAMDPQVRAVMRSYTVREQRRTPHEIDVDFALHGDSGAASHWAARALPGDRVTVLGPTGEDNGGVDFRPPAGTDWVLLSGDETALPAIAGILSWLPAGTSAKVWLEVPYADDIQPLPTLADADITWLVRDTTTLHRTDFVLGSVRSAVFPAGTGYAWVAGESGTVRTLRRHLVRERYFDRGAVKFTGYWRLGASEEQLVEEAVSGASAA